MDELEEMHKELNHLKTSYNKFIVMVQKGFVLVTRSHLIKEKNDEALTKSTFIYLLLVMLGWGKDITNPWFWRK